MNHDADPDLLRAWGEGDHEAYATLVVRHHGLVRAACLRQAPSEFVDDCVQAVFLVLFRRPSAAAKAPILTAWLLKVCSNVCHTVRRTEVRRQATERVAAQQQSHADHESTGHSEALAHLDECLQLLPEAQRTAVSLQYLTGCSGSEVASTMGISRPNAYRLAERGLAALRELLVRRQVTMGMGALVGLLGTQAHAAAVPVSATTLISLTTGTPSTAASALATGTLKAMTITALTTPLLAAAGLILTVGAATFAMSAEGGTKPPPAPAAVPTAAFVPIAYDLATPGAHNPCYDRKDLGWPADVQKTAYYKEKWEPARLLVWRVADTKQKQSVGPEQYNNPANWQEYPVTATGYGTPQAATAPPDDNTDVVLAIPNRTDKDDQREMVVWNISKMRHLTIGPAVRLDSGDDSVPVPVIGNVWVEGIWTSIHNKTVPQKDSFLHTIPSKSKRGQSRVDFKTLHCDKAAGHSLEIQGRVTVGDWMEVNTGMLIVGPNSYLGTGNRHQNIIAPKGAIILMSGSVMQTNDRKVNDYDLAVFGRLDAGTAERPLTADVTIPLNGKPRHGKGDRSLRFEPTSSMTVHSADPLKARLVFKKRMNSDQDDRAQKEKYQGQFGPIDVVFGGKTSFDGVFFDDVSLGGIQIKDEEVRKDWKNITFGDKNAGKPDELFAVIGAISLSGAHDEQRAAQAQIKQLAEEAEQAKKAGSPETKPAVPAPK